jgi:UMF1 family MFS transporter
MRPKPETLARWSWIAVDVGNSAFATTVLAAVFPLYWRSVLARGTGPGEAAALYGYLTAASMILAALAAPLLGAAADASGRRKGAFAAATLLGVAATGAMALLSPGSLSWGGALFLLASLGFSLSSVFYDSFLPHLAPGPEGDRLSSSGYAAGYLGGGVLLAADAAILLVFPDERGFAGVFLSVALWWGAFSCPLLRFVPEPPPAPAPEGILRASFRRPWDLARGLLRPENRNLALYLAAFWLYNDGIGTVMRMGALYGAAVGLPDATLVLALVATQFVAAPCAIGFARLAGRIGGKPALLVSLGGYAAIGCFLPFVDRPSDFWIVALAVGAVQGGAQALSRSLYADLVPSRQSAEYFGFYDLSGKFAGVLGPLLFGLVSDLTGSVRPAGPLLSLFFLVSCLLLRRVRMPAR